MDDFNSYIKNNKSENGKNGQTSDKQNILKLVSSLASKYDGKNQNDLLKAIYEEARKGKQAGTLTNEEIDKFSNLLSPFLDGKQKILLKKIVAELKKI